MVFAVVSMKKGYTKTHASFITGTMLGPILAGIFAIMPGGLINSLFG